MTENESKTSRNLSMSVDLWRPVVHFYKRKLKSQSSQLCLKFNTRYSDLYRRELNFLKEISYRPCYRRYSFEEIESSYDIWKDSR